MLEAECTRCGGIFVPHGTNMEDLIHAFRDDDETECGGIGLILGEWVRPEGTPLYDFGDHQNLTPQELHGVREPNCSDPDCEFHHPELIEL